MLKRRPVLQRNDLVELRLQPLAVFLQAINNYLRALAQDLGLALTVIRAPFEHERHVEQISTREASRAIKSPLRDDLDGRFRRHCSAANLPDGRRLTRQRR